MSWTSWTKPSLWGWHFASGIAMAKYFFTTLAGALSGSLLRFRMILQRKFGQFSMLCTVMYVFLCSPKLAEQGCMSADFCVVNIHVYCVSFFANKELIGWWRKLESKGTTRISSWKDSGRSTTPWYPFQSWCHRHPQTIDPGKAKESDGDITEDPRFGSQRPLGKEGCWKGPSDMSHVSRLIPPVNPLKFWDQKSSADHVWNHSSDSCHSKRSVIKDKHGMPRQRSALPEGA